VQKSADKSSNEQPGSVALPRGKFFRQRQVNLAARLVAALLSIAAGTAGGAIAIHYGDSSYRSVNQSSHGQRGVNQDSGNAASNQNADHGASNQNAGHAGVIQNAGKSGTNQNAASGGQVNAGQSGSASSAGGNAGATAAGGSATASTGNTSAEGGNTTVNLPPQPTKRPCTGSPVDLATDRYTTGTTVNVTAMVKCSPADGDLYGIVAELDNVGPGHATNYYPKAWMNSATGTGSYPISISGSSVPSTRTFFVVDCGPTYQAEFSQASSSGEYWVNSFPGCSVISAKALNTRTA
jgi:hypothetical protein